MPGGTKIAVAGWAMQRATNVYGADADVFRPEEAREMNRMLDLIFGFGRFGCLGRAIAFVELDKVFVEVSSLPPLSCLSLDAPFGLACVDEVEEKDEGANRARVSAAPPLRV